MADGRSQTYRTTLPFQQPTKKDGNIFSILKNCIGKELSSITMPVEFNEPLSFLQRISEYMEYSYLLKKANEAEDPKERLQYVSAFAVSALASNWKRLNKPFNPLLGESYELCREDLGFRLVCEQVSHHPPVSAFHAESEGCYRFYGSIHPKLKFWGKSLQIKPEGVLNVELLAYNEVYSWSNVNCCVHNIIIGKLWFEQHGLMEIHCQTTGYFVQLNFKPAGWFCKDLHRVEGFMFDPQKEKILFLYGKWTSYLKIASIEDYDEYSADTDNNSRSKGTLSIVETGSNHQDGTDDQAPAKSKSMVSRLNVFSRSFTSGGSTDRAVSPEPPVATHDPPDVLEDGAVPKSDSTLSFDIPNSEMLWQAQTRTPDSEKYYNFTSFAIALNEIISREVLPSTDCRLRPDIRLLESGDADKAGVEKGRLEEKQRDARKQRKKRKETWIPKWFTQEKVSHLKNDIWVFNQKYWAHDFSDVMDIF